MKKRFSIVSELSADRIAELHSDWPKRHLGPQVPIFKVHFTPYSNGMPKRLNIVHFNLTKLWTEVQ